MPPPQSTHSPKNIITGKVTPEKVPLKRRPFGTPNAPVVFSNSNCVQMLVSLVSMGTYNKEQESVARLILLH